MTGKTAAVVGGGISGLATAYRLLHPADGGPPIDRVVVCEAAARVGGVADTERRDGWSLETGANGFLDNKPSTTALCRDVGVELVSADAHSARRYVFLGDRLRKLPGSALEFVFSDLLSPWGKIRLLAERLVGGPPRDGRTDESILEFTRRRFGNEAADVLVESLVTGIYAGDPALLSVRSCFPRLVAWEREYGGVLKAQTALARERKAKRLAEGLPPAPPGSAAGVLMAPRGGMRTLTEALTAKLGDRIAVNATVRRLEQTENRRWRIEADGRPPLEADAVILAAPAPEQAALLRPIDGLLADEIQAIPYTTAVIVVVGYRRSDLPMRRLDGFGYLAPQRLKRPVLGVLWSSSIFPDQAPDDCYQFRAILGGWQRRDVLQWTDRELVEAVRADLAAALGVAASPIFQWIYRWP
ncbi:MAG: protoporphyrinogen oxidase, partial [Planctomycetia bacterium]